VSAHQNTFVEPDFVAVEPDEETFCASDENSWQETHAADAKTVETRKRSSALVASFSAVFRRSGIPEACRTLGLDLNEIKSLLLTGMDAGQRAEYLAEAENRPCSKVRRFKCAAYRMEMFYKRVNIPLELNEEEKKKWIDSRGRNWRRRFKRLHLAQCFTHLPFLVCEKGESSSAKLITPDYIDNLTDVVADTARRAARLRGEPIGRYNKAADEALAHFRETLKDKTYAPEWTLEDYKKIEEAKPAAAAGPKTDDPRTGVKKAALKLVTEGKRVARESGMSEEEEIDYRKAIHAEIETLWTSRPPNTPKPKATRAVLTSPSPVIVNTDTTKNDAPAVAKNRTPVSYLNHEETQNHSANSQTVEKVHATNFLTPTEQATRAAEAFESVGCDKFKAVFLGIYPLNGEAERLGCEPKQNGESMTAAEFKSRVPEYVKRNQKQHHNVAVRAWGAIIQVDDCNAEILERLRPFAFYAEETSPGNYQVWLALPKAFVGADGKINEAGKAIRKRLLEKFEERGEFANGGAYSSTRLPGTLNIKEKYQPSFPLIRLTHVAMGRIVTPEELEAAALLADVPAAPAITLVESSRYANSKLPTEWPDYHYYVSRAPLKEDGQPNLSRADESFAVRCLSLGHPSHSVISRLQSVRDKAARRHDYAERTVRAAEHYLASQPVQQGRERMTI
jgi:hypothetical protein